MSSVDAAHDRAMLVPVRVPMTTLVGADGASVSGHAVVVAVTSARGDSFPAASYASTPSGYAVPHARPLNVAVVWVVSATRLEPRYSPYPATPVSSVDGDQVMRRLVDAAATTLGLPGIVGAEVSFVDGPRGGVDDGDAGDDPRPRPGLDRLAFRNAILVVTEAKLVVTRSEIQRRLERRRRVRRDDATRCPELDDIRRGRHRHLPGRAPLDDVAGLEAARPATGRWC